MVKVWARPECRYMKSARTRLAGWASGFGPRPGPCRISNVYYIMYFIFSSYYSIIKLILKYFTFFFLFLLKYEKETSHSYFCMEYLLKFLFCLFNKDMVILKSLFFISSVFDLYDICVLLTRVLYSIWTCEFNFKSTQNLTLTQPKNCLPSKTFSDPDITRE